MITENDIKDFIRRIGKKKEDVKNSSSRGLNMFENWGFFGIRKRKEEKNNRDRRESKQFDRSNVFDLFKFLQHFKHMITD